tara:strand:- start:699 stop:1790 length:1092 start_codon:yes stop_codon:yes gene_type:complete
MKIGVPKEVKNNEFRVGLTPESVKTLCQNNHEVFIERNAGNGIGYTNSNYINSGAIILNSSKEIFESSELIVKVKEPVPDEFQYLSKKHTLFTFLHLAGDLKQGLDLISTGVTGIAYETITSENGSLPLLSPMSAIAGQLSIIVGSYHLLKHNNGKGILIGYFEDIEPRIVTVLGAGVAGTEAISKAIENNSFLKIIDISKNKLAKLKNKFGTNNIEYIKSTKTAIANALTVSDLVIGAVYVLGKQAPQIVSKDMISNMKPGSVIVDISIDQGGCFETSYPTDHNNPTFLVDGVVHYCVPNMPAAVPLTATNVLNKVTLPYILDLANKGIKRALDEDKHLFNGLNIRNGEIIHPSVRESFGSF